MSAAPDYSLEEEEEEEGEEDYRRHSRKPGLRESFYAPEKPEPHAGLSRRRRARLLREISEWKREARSEDSDRYFWHVAEVDLLLRGTRYFVIGRKGTGKTAICQYLETLREFDKFAVRLNFSKFPIKELYDLGDKTYAAPNQYISLWKFVIYNQVCRLLLSNENVDSEFRKKLKEAYTAQGDLRDEIKSWVSEEFMVRLGVIAGKIKMKDKDTPWHYRLNLLEALLVEHAGDSSYFLLFDELDADYASVASKGSSSNYFDLISSLFKAVQDIRLKFSGVHSAKIRPIIFLRDDIYSQILDVDKNKWEDARVDLHWDAARLKELINYRIRRAADGFRGDKIFDIDLSNADSPSWETLFISADFVPFGRRKRVSIFENLCMNSLMRPRDFVAYLNYCASRVKPNDARIPEEIVIDTETEFSTYMYNEFIDEMFVEVPAIKKVLAAIAGQGDTAFFLENISDDLKKLLCVGADGRIGLDSPLEALFAFSLIGIKLPNSPRPLFRYLGRYSIFDPSREIIVHPGLYKFLHLKVKRGKRG